MGSIIPIDLEKLKEYLLEEFNVEFNIDEINIKNDFIEKTISSDYTYKKILKGKNKNKLIIKKITKLPNKENYKNNGRRRSNSSDCDFNDEDKTKININNNIVIDNAKNIINDILDQPKEEEIKTLNVINSVNLNEKKDKNNFDILNDKIKSDINIINEENKIVIDDVKLFTSETMVNKYDNILLKYNKLNNLYLDLLRLNKKNVDQLKRMESVNKSISFINDFTIKSLNIVNFITNNPMYRVIGFKFSEIISIEVYNNLLILIKYLFESKIINVDEYNKYKKELNKFN